MIHEVPNFEMKKSSVSSNFDLMCNLYFGSGVLKKAPEVLAVDPKMVLTLYNNDLLRSIFWYFCTSGIKIDHCALPGEVWIVFWMSKVRPRKKYSYGFLFSSIKENRFGFDWNGIFGALMSFLKIEMSTRPLLSNEANGWIYFDPKTKAQVGAMQRSFRRQ